MDYATAAATSYLPDSNEDIFQSLISQYRQIVLQSIVTSFGLDALFFDDQYGGDVDTVHNVRQIGVDSKMRYKSADNQRAYEAQGQYSKGVSTELHQTEAYIARNREISAAKKDGRLVDAYTGKTVARNADVDLDHVISAKEIHGDRGRVLAGMSASDLASRADNLQPTDRSLNRSMKDKSISEYISWLDERQIERRERIRKLRDLPTRTGKQESELHKLETQEQVDREAMREADRKARSSYDSAINSTYYTSRHFWGSTAKAAAKSSGLMALRQALGLMFVEVWLCVEDEIAPFVRDDSDRLGNGRREEFDLSGMLKAVGNGLTKGMRKALADYGKILKQLGQGAVAGALSSLTTTLANAFFTTSANAVTLIRQAYASLVQAGEVLFINPNCYAAGERLRAFCKIIATGASVVAGTLVSQALLSSPLSKIPGVGDSMPSICGSIVTGIMSVTLLLFFDRSRIMNRLVCSLDQLHTIDAEVAALRAWADGFERYAAQLEGIDYDELAREMSVYDSLMAKLDGSLSGEELTEALMAASDSLGFSLPWVGSFDEFMSNKDNTLVFG